MQKRLFWQDYHTVLAEDIAPRVSISHALWAHWQLLQHSRAPLCGPLGRLWSQHGSPGSSLLHAQVTGGHQYAGRGVFFKE